MRHVTRWKGRRTVFGVVLGAVVWAAAVPGPGQAQEATWPLVRLSYSSGWDAVPAVVALDRGFFIQERVMVDGIPRTSDRALASSLAAGSTDVAAVSQQLFLLMAAANLPVKVVAMGGWGTEMEVVVPKDDTTTRRIQDLKGKTVAMAAGSEALPVLVRLLNKARLRPVDVRLKFLSPEALLQVFRATPRAADAVIESRHYTMSLVQADQARVALSHRDIVGAIGVIGAAPLLARAPLVEKEPETVQKVVNAWVKALVYIRQDPEDAARLMTIFLHRQGVQRAVPALVKSWLGLTQYTRASWSPDDIADAEYNAWALQTAGLVKQAPKLAALVDNRFAETAWRRIQAGAAPVPPR